MMKDRTELHTFSKEEVERMVSVATMTKIVGHLFIGSFDEQTVHWTEDGGVQVVTKYREGDMSDVQSAQATAHRGTILM